MRTFARLALGLVLVLSLAAAVTLADEPFQQQQGTLKVLDRAAGRLVLAAGGHDVAFAVTARTWFPFEPRAGETIRVVYRTGKDGTLTALRIGRAKYK